MKIRKIYRDSRSVSAGIFVPVGSAFEDGFEQGLSHFIEHMLFKGTKKRSYKEIAADIDRLGGVINAFTSTEYTGFYIKVLRDYFYEAFDVLVDIISNSTIPEDELNKEKGVIIEEINMTNDNPDDAVYEAFMENAISGTYGKSILGKKELIEAYTREDLLKFMGKHYKPESMVLSIAGGLQDDKLHLPESFFFEKYASESTIEPSFSFKPGIDVVKRDIFQTNVVLGCSFIDVYDERKYAAYVLNEVFGGTMSSRLFQSIREEKSLCYSIYSTVKFYKKGGLFLINAATSNSNTQKLIDSIKEEILKLKRDLITDRELEDSKTHFIGSYGLSLESTHSVMIKLASDELIYGRYLPEDEIIAKIRALKMDDIAEIIDLIDIDKFHITCLGNIDSVEW
ncbi:M16 family metallopeptidase [Hippea jasoniae]|uniref:M16 family metallopeptidase n=1 Tax=Hippea jasoniae TaxID=944479 RepID=UPI0005584BA3|nr:pitrilysin family protein [Hippea jasoniae]